MPRVLGFVLAVLTVLASVSALFFGYHGVRLIVYLATYDGEGSLGHVGAWTAAGLLPLLAFVSLIVAISLGRAARRRLRG